MVAARCARAAIVGEGWSVASYRELVREIVREAPGPLALDEILRRVSERQAVRTANPKSTIRNALQYNEGVGSLGDGRYVYIPRVITGSSFLVGMPAPGAFGAWLDVGEEVVACIADAGPARDFRREISLHLVGGATVQAGRVPWAENPGALSLPDECLGWLAGQRQAGADALVLRCLAGEAARFSLEGIRLADRAPDAVAARNDQVLAVARELLKRGSLLNFELAERLVIRGAYQGEPQPDPLPHLLFEVDGRFVYEHAEGIAFHPDLTPELRELFADRMRRVQASVRPDLLRGAPGPTQTAGARRRLRVIQGWSSLGADPGARSAAARQLYRLKVSLRWDRHTWRVIEMLDDQTLADLHEGIQDAFGWDRDHLYAFFLSGRAWDRLTAIFCSDCDDEQPPLADEMPLSALALKPGSRFLYLFDFGDELHHDVEVLEVLPAPASGTFPRIAEVRGEAPPQYPTWDEEE